MMNQRKLEKWLGALLIMAASVADSRAAGDDKSRYTVMARSVIERRSGEYGGNDQKREATLKQQFTEAGCDSDHLTEQRVKGEKLPNVICILPGETSKVVIVGAHFDHIDRGNGVVDNWSGASLLPSLYESLKNVPRTHTYIFIGFTAEESGEIGSHFYAHQMSKEEVAATEAMVNMDTLGLGQTAVWLSHSDKELSGMLAAAGKQLKLPVEAINVEQVGSTDSEQFAARKIPSITIHTLTQEAWNARILHTEKDKMSAMRLDDYYDNYRVITLYLVALDKWLPTSPATKSH
jgi:Peptidase family M28